MKTYLDLLPEERRTAIIRTKHLRGTIFQELIFAFPVVLLLVVLVTINAVLKIQVESIAAIYKSEQGLKGYQELQRYEDKFKEINSKVSMVSKIQDSHLQWTEVLVKINNLIPEGVYLTGLVNKEYNISISGKAAKREDFIKFQDAIEKSECFTNFDNPLSNLVSKENIDFQIDFDVKKECLIKN